MPVLILGLYLTWQLARELYHTVSLRTFWDPGQTALSNLAIYKQLQYIAESDYFTKVQIDISGGRLDEARQCSGDSCAATKRIFSEKKSVIDLLQVCEAYSEHAAEELARIWPAFHQVVNGDAHLSRLLNGLQLSITTHMAVYYRSYFNWYAPRLEILEQVYSRSLRSDLEELYKVYRAAVASLLYNNGEVPSSVLELSTEIMRQNAAQLMKREHNSSVPYLRASFNFLDRNYIDRPYISLKVLPLFGEMIKLLRGSDCNECILWLTIQVSGLMAAVKALNNKPLDKAELACLIYAFRRASVSIRECSRLMDPRFVILRLPPIHYFEPCLFLIGFLYLVYPYRSYLPNLPDIANFEFINQVN
ncbi:hypothetical protein PAPHI01_0211 [Pancytospora philotis]|nr:hypothetical protein PAPHI01_0211 [Pancytospora philotis]